MKFWSQLLGRAARTSKAPPPAIGNRLRYVSPLDLPLTEEGRLLGLPYSLVVGKPDPTDDRPVHRRWTVDIDALTKRIKDYM